MLMINDLSATKELARDEMSTVYGGKDVSMHTDSTTMYPTFPSFVFSDQDNDLVSASINQQMLNDIDVAFGTVNNNPTQNANINVFA